MAPNITKYIPADKKVVLFFGAANYVTLNKFVPTISAISENMAKSRPEVLFLFISRDKSKKDFDQIASKIPFNAIPFKDQDTIQELIRRYDSPPKKLGLARVVVMYEGHNVVNADAEHKMQKSIVSTGADFPWNGEVQRNLCMKMTACVLCTIQ